MTRKFLRRLAAAAAGAATQVVAPGGLRYAAGSGSCWEHALAADRGGDISDSAGDHLSPGTDTGWHYYDGPLYARVLAGTLSLFFRSDTGVNVRKILHESRLVRTKSIGTRTGPMRASAEEPFLNSVQFRKMTYRVANVCREVRTSGPGAFVCFGAKCGHVAERNVR
jgi:hypothetical protein